MFNERDNNIKDSNSSKKLDSFLKEIRWELKFFVEKSGEIY